VEWSLWLQLAPGSAQAAPAPAGHKAWMSQPCRSNDVNVAFTPYGPVLMMPAGQVALQRTIPAHHADGLRH
jgi:hypothetical protein